MLLVSANPNYTDPFVPKKPDKITCTGDLSLGFSIRQLPIHSRFTKSFEPISGRTTPNTLVFGSSLNLGSIYTIEIYFNSGSFNEESKTLLSCNGSAFDLYFFAYSTGNYIRFRKGTSNYIDSPVDILQPDTDYHLIIRSSSSKIEMILNGETISTNTSVSSIASFSTLYVASQTYYSGQEYLKSSLYYFNIWNHYVLNSKLFSEDRINNPSTPQIELPIIFLEDYSILDRYPNDTVTNKHIEGKVQKEGNTIKGERAVVYLLESDGFKFKRSKVTDINGTFIFKNIPLGNYILYSTLQSSKYNPEVLNNIEVK